MSLLALQRDFRVWLTTENEGAGARLDEEGAGLSVYLNNYRSALMACLTASFEATSAWLGETAFAAAAATHIDRLPPHSWTLDDYALDFPETLQSLYPDDPEVGDLARLERALGLAFVGPDADPIDPASLADVDWDRVAIRFMPTLDILIVRSNAAAIWSAIAAHEPPPHAQVSSMPLHIAIWRNDLLPVFRTLEVDELDALENARKGKTFGALCADLVDRHGEESGPALAGALLGQWLQDGLVGSVNQGPAA